MEMKVLFRQKAGMEGNWEWRHKNKIRTIDANFKIDNNSEDRLMLKLIFFFHLYLPNSTYFTYRLIATLFNVKLEKWNKT